MLFESFSLMTSFNDIQYVNTTNREPAAILIHMFKDNCIIYFSRKFAAAGHGAGRGLSVVSPQNRIIIFFMIII